eukprot:gene17693-23283_t
MNNKSSNVPTKRGVTTNKSKAKFVLPTRRSDENDIAKVTEARVTSVFCHPSSNKLIVAAGDKAGFLGLWDVDKTDVYNGGVYKYRPHVESIIRLHASNNEPSKIYSASYDDIIVGGNSSGRLHVFR